MDTNNHELNGMEGGGSLESRSPLTRSTAAEYLTFITSSGEGGVEAVYADQDVWLSQKMMAALYDIDVRTVNYHLKKCFSDSELQEDSVIRDFRITAADGSGTRSTPNARCSSASGPRASSRSSPSRASRWTTSASSEAAPS